ncbi:MAG: hypothetical protein ACRDHX_09775 [Chloroflexota bacterium]
MGFLFDRDATGLAAGGSIAMLCLYTLALMFTLQHVAEQYSPALWGPLARRAVKWWIALGLLVLLAAAAVWLPLSTPVEVAAVVLLLASVALALTGAGRAWQTAADRGRVLALLRGLPPPALAGAACDVLLAAAARADMALASAVFGVLGSRAEAHVQVLDWLACHETVASAPWLTAEAVASVEERVGGESAERLRKPLVALLEGALTDESYRRCRLIVSGVMRGLERADPFSEVQASLLWQLGQALWERGDEGGSEPRRWAQRRRLADLQQFYLAELARLWRTITVRHDQMQLTSLAGAVQRLPRVDLELQAGAGGPSRGPLPPAAGLAAPLTAVVAAGEPAKAPPVGDAKKAGKGKRKGTEQRK